MFIGEFQRIFDTTCALLLHQAGACTPNQNRKPILAGSTIATTEVQWGRYGTMPPAKDATVSLWTTSEESRKLENGLR